MFSILGEATHVRCVDADADLTLTSPPHLVKMSALWLQVQVEVEVDFAIFDFRIGIGSQERDPEPNRNDFVFRRMSKVIFVAAQQLREGKGASRASTSKAKARH